MAPIFRNKRKVAICKISVKRVFISITRKEHILNLQFTPIRKRKKQKEIFIMKD